MDKAETTTVQRIVSGSFGGVCSVIATHPLDTIRVRLQLQQPIQVNRLYAGIVPMLAGVVPVAAMSFLGYDLGARMVPFDVQAENSQALTLLRYTAVGTTSAVFASVLVVPGECLKIKMQHSGASLAKVLQQYRGNYLKLYRGTGVTLLRDVPAYMIWFAVYERTKSYLTRREYAGQEQAVMISGAAAGVAQWTAVLPIDTVKTRI